MHCSLCCGGGDGGGGGSGNDSGDWTQYCNLHCVIVVVVVFFLKQGGLFPKAVVHVRNACIATCAVVVVVLECTWYSGCTCMVCMVVVAGGGGMRCM